MKTRISNAQAIKPKANLSLEDSLCEYQGVGVTTHTNAQPPVLSEHKNIKTRFTREAYLSGTRMVVIKFMGYVYYRKTGMPAAQDLIK